VSALRSLALCLVLASGAVPALESQPVTSLETVMHRAGLFALQQRDALTSVRADEHYLQELRVAGGGVLQTRRLDSEIAFVQLSGREEWLAFRNVVKVDGEPTGTDTARLEKLFREGTIAEQGSRIAEENAIYNIGRLKRTFNIPTFPTYFLMPQQRSRLRFKRVSDKPDPSGLWEVSYEERERPTMVRTPERQDVPVKGRLWIAPDDGHVVRATLQVETPVESELQFTWRYDEKLASWVPSEMREAYRRIRHEKPPPRSYDIVCVATYSNYRRFGVEVRIR
jgi:hypothetical protein